MSCIIVFIYCFYLIFSKSKFAANHVLVEKSIYFTKGCMFFISPLVDLCKGWWNIDQKVSGGDAYFLLPVCLVMNSARNAELFTSIVMERGPPATLQPGLVPIVYPTPTINQGAPPVGTLMLFLYFCTQQTYLEMTLVFMWNTFLGWTGAWST